jgi:hypothetical protein
MLDQRNLDQRRAGDGMPESKIRKNISTTDYCSEDLTHHLIQEAPKKLFLLEGTIPSENEYDELKFGTRALALDGITSIADVGGGTFAVHI